ncbi:MAG: hydrogenase maturation nickel metallochaperone HypA [Elusimicrobiota bacterium]
MHEWSITESVIKEILSQAQKNNINKIERVSLALCEDGHLTVESVKLCFEYLSKGTILENVKLEIEKIIEKGIVIKSIEGKN